MLWSWGKKKPLGCSNRKGTPPSVETSKTHPDRFKSLKFWVCVTETSKDRMPVTLLSLFDPKFLEVTGALRTLSWPFINLNLRLGSIPPPLPPPSLPLPPFWVLLALQMPMETAFHHEFTQEEGERRPHYSTWCLLGEEQGRCYILAVVSIHPGVGFEPQRWEAPGDLM